MSNKSIDYNTKLSFEFDDTNFEYNYYPIGTSEFWVYHNSNSIRFNKFDIVSVTNYSSELLATGEHQYIDKLIDIKLDSGIIISFNFEAIDDQFSDLFYCILNIFDKKIINNNPLSGSNPFYNIENQFKGEYPDYFCNIVNYK